MRIFRIKKIDSEYSSFIEIKRSLSSAGAIDDHIIVPSSRKKRLNVFPFG